MYLKLDSNFLLSISKWGLEKKDIRREKKYGATVGFKIRVFDLNDKTRHLDMSWNTKDFNLLVEARTITAGSSWKVSVDTSWCDLPEEYAKGKEDHRIPVLHFSYYVSVEKPSLIPEDPDMAVFSIDKKLNCEVIEKAAIRFVETALKNHLDAEGRKEKAAEANHLAHQLAKEADEKAREIVRYDQRLAGLDAELEAERKLQLDVLIKEFKDKPEYEDGKKIDVKVVIAACNAAGKVTLKPRIFHFGQQEVVGQEDV